MGKTPPTQQKSKYKLEAELKHANIQSRIYSMTQTILYKFRENLVQVLSGNNLYIHLFAITLTTVLVTSGFDGWYFSSTRNTTLQSFLFPATFVGGVLPILLPLFLYLIGSIKKNRHYTITAYALAQAAFMGWFISSTYKAFTGRAHPAIHRSALFDNLNTNPLVNIDTLSREFHFGFLKGGIFWGWPSSHTTVAFSVAFTIWAIYQKNTIIKYTAVIIAAYVGIGISTNIHWFSDFVAGALIGTIIGKQIGKNFLKKQEEESKTN
ncbi:phosphatase PAP2 family protein [Candidatus Gracilibacteria bacterium]|nr:phosphatase PAP2 family protein [Candidatus Gracilibacteria bacterium]